MHEQDWIFGLMFEVSFAAGNKAKLGRKAQITAVVDKHLGHLFSRNSLQTVEQSTKELPVFERFDLKKYEAAGAHLPH